MSQGVHDSARNSSPSAKPDQAARHEATIAELQAVIAGLIAQNEVLAARAKKPTRTASLLREPTDKKSGGQPGHKGRTLERRPTLDAIADHFPTVCTGCGAPLGRHAHPQPIP